jgi:hypothetical protein
MLLHPTYFPNIAHFRAILKTESVLFEVNDNYQKQTYRNRCEIYGANGKLALTVPVNYTQKNRQKSKDVQISDSSNWQIQHLKSLESAYRMSPFYEFYIDDLTPLFETKFKFLLDLNLKCFEILSEALELNKAITTTTVFMVIGGSKDDFRFLVNPKVALNLSFKEYTQVFTQKHGFIPNLSILDLLFNEGPNTGNFLYK